MSTGCRTARLAAEIPNAVRKYLSSVNPEPLGNLSRVLAAIRILGRKSGGAGQRLFVRLAGEDGTRHAFDLGTLSGSSPPVSVLTGWPAFGARVPADRSVLLVSVVAEFSGNIRASVEQFEGGLAHGFDRDGPASARVSGNGEATASYAYRGMDVSGLIASPVTSVAAATGGHQGVLAGELFGFGDHPEAAGLVEAAEVRDEAIVISAAGHPGIHAVRVPGSGCYLLMDDDQLSGLSDAWRRRNAVQLSVQQAAGPDADECRLLRKVGGLMDGTTDVAPGLCVSRAGNSGGPATVLKVHLAAGQKLGAAEVAGSPACGPTRPAA